MYTIATAGAPGGAPGSRGLPSPDPGQGLAAPDPAPEGSRSAAGEEGTARPGRPSAEERKRKQDVCCQLVFLSASVGAMLREEEVSEAVSHGLSLVLDRMAEDLQAAIDANSAARRA